MAKLDDARRQWVTDHKNAMEKAVAEAITASNRWRAINAAIVVKAAAQKWDDYTTAKAKAASMPLTDAYAAYSFHAGKAQMHAAVLQGALAAEQLLADDDPTGLLYSRDDDEPVRPVPPGVDGLSITGRPKRRPSPNSPAGSAFDTVERRTHLSSGRPGSQTAGAGTPTPAPATPRAGAR